MRRPAARGGGRAVTGLEAVTLTIVTAATPLLIAALGELVTERSGVLNLGVEGMMIVGAVTGFAGAQLDRLAAPRRRRRHGRRHGARQPVRLPGAAARRQPGRLRPRAHPARARPLRHDRRGLHRPAGSQARTHRHTVPDGTCPSSAPSCSGRIRWSMCRLRWRSASPASSSIPGQAWRCAPSATTTPPPICWASMSSGPASWPCCSAGPVPGWRAATSRWPIPRNGSRA